MEIIAYLYSDPLLDSLPSPEIWGQEVDRVYQDLGKRQQLLQLIEDCQTKPPNYLLIRRLEELGDTLEEVGDRLTQLESLGVEIVATEQDYTSSELKKANLAKILEEIANNQRCRRLKQGHARNRLKTLPPPGKAPYGYRRGKDRYIIDRSTAPVVKDFCDRFLLFGSLRGAVRYLEKRYGKKISVSTGRRWLTSPVYRGNLIYQNSEIISNTHAAIISREEAAQIDRLLRRNSRLPSRTASAPRSLAGLVVCQQCNSHMTVTRVTTRDKKREYLYLRALDCPISPKCGAISYDRVLEKTIEKICQDLPVAVAQMNLPSAEGIKGMLGAEIAKREEIIAKLPTLQQQGILDEETAQLRNYKLRAEISSYQIKLAGLPPVNLQELAQTVSIAQFWQDLSEAERRFYFREFIKQVEIVRQQENCWKLEIVFIF
ncbi:MAG: recombinase family protein [Prochloraceae cyanobacterium]|nr:recombinase family protein [Prochloraceae cyanobacterium]